MRTLKRRFPPDSIPYPKYPSRRIPKVISPEEVTQLIDAASNVQARAILMLLYSTGGNQVKTLSLSTDRRMEQSAPAFVVGSIVLAILLDHPDAFVNQRVVQVPEPARVVRQNVVPLGGAPSNPNNANRARNTGQPGCVRCRLVAMRSVALLAGVAYIAKDGAQKRVEIIFAGATSEL